MPDKSTDPAPDPVPLPLTPFEEYWLGDNIPAYPANVFVRLRFSGRFDRETFETVLRETLALHPLLCCLVKKTGKRRFEWVEAPESHRPRIRWRTEHASEVFPVSGRCFDLENETGLELNVLERGDGTSDLALEFHHSLCDGSGIMGFLWDLLENYHERAGGSFVNFDTKKRQRISLRDLALRGNSNKKYESVFTKTAACFSGLTRSFHFLARRPVTLLPFPVDRLPKEDAPAPLGSYPAACTLELDRDEVRKVREQARSRDVSLNTWLITVFYRAALRYREKHGVVNPKRVIRMAIPVNLRTKNDPSRSAHNNVSLVFLDRDDPSQADKDKLARGIQREITHIVRHNLGHVFLTWLGLFKRLGGDMRWAARKRCWTSAVITHLGAPFFCTNLPKDGSDRFVIGGDEKRLVLEECHFASPLRPWVAAVVGSVEYAGSLRLTLHYDAWAFTKDDMTELLDYFRRELMH